MKQSFRIDLREIEGEGEFLCPTCREIISPDDESGMTYDILEIGTEEDGMMHEVVIQCRTCGSVIRLAGFEALAETENLEYLDDYLSFRVDLEKT
jgi:hypothetical protein